MDLSSLKNAVSVINRVVKDMPLSSGIYKMLDEKSEVIYIGKAKVLPNRVKSYANYQALPNRLRRMVARICKIEYIITNTEAEALLLEASLIKSVKPVFNILLKDDKSFPYILFDRSHSFPRVLKYRGKKDLKGEYFGPFASVRQVENAIAEIQKVFLIRPCTNVYFESRSRPCLQYQIKRCSAPCVGKITVDDYEKNLKFATDFLKGKDSVVNASLVEQMEAASEKMDYEKAAKIRDRIQLLSAIRAKNTFNNSNISDADIIACARSGYNICITIFFMRGGRNYGDKSYYYKNIVTENDSDIIELFIGQFYQRNHVPSFVVIAGDAGSKTILQEALLLKSESKVKVVDSTSNKFKDLVEFANNNCKEKLLNHLKEVSHHRKSLDELSKLFGVAEVNRVELYDNSHISGDFPVGCMVVYNDEGFDKSGYRLYNLESSNKGDDYDMMREMFTRRFKKLDSVNRPDIIFVDGGKGQLGVVKKVMSDMKVEGIKIVGISKGPDRNAGRETFYTDDGLEFRLNQGDDLLSFLQVLRDEVHRFAINNHRRKRSKGVTASKLDDIPAIGQSRKRKLLSYFGSYDAVLEADLEDIMKVEGFNRALAEKIFSYLHKK